MNVGIVGHEGAKFGPGTEAAARRIIRAILQPGDVMVSGACHLGGIDVWAEEEALALGHQTKIFPPKKLEWREGYKPRNLLIAQHSDIVHCIVVAELPPGYTGMRFKFCYHDKRLDHVKSGGCWTAMRCPKRQWWIIRPDASVRVVPGS